jgi:uroporphyrinogen-III synthase
MEHLFDSVGLEVIELRKFHELSFPYEFYLKKMLRSEALVMVSLPAVKAFFRLFKIRNKMLAIGRKI